MNIFDSEERVQRIKRVYDNILAVPRLDGGIVQTRAAAVGEEYSLVLLRHQGLLRDTFYLNKRPEHEKDNVYSGKWGLFGGKVKQHRGAMPREGDAAAARREISEETGLTIGEDLIELAVITGYNNQANQTKGVIFQKILRTSPYRAIKNYLKDENPRLRKAGENEIGEIRTIHKWRIGGHFFVRWWKLTPQAIYALSDVLERDTTQIK